MTRIAIIIVNYRTPALTLDCLASLHADGFAPRHSEVIVVDNSSGDGSVERLADQIECRGWSSWVTLLPSVDNRGFAAGNNIAIESLLKNSGVEQPEYILLLNPDTLALPGAIEALVRFADAHPNVGIAGSRLENPDGSPQTSAFHFHTLAGEFESGIRLGAISRLLSRWRIAPPPRNDPHPIDWVAGASMLIRTEVLRKSGPLDEGYFMYYEEVDLCLRTKAAGWQCWYVPDSRVVHLVGQSSGVTDKDRSREPLPKYWFDSRRRYFQKNHGRLYAILAESAFLFGLSLWNARRILLGRPSSEASNRFSGGLKWVIYPTVCGHA